MAAQSLLARLGLRVATLGSAASLAIAAPIAEGDVSQSAHTHDARTGFYFPTADSIGVVTNAVERMRLYNDGGVQIGGSFGTSPGASALSVSGVSLLSGIGNTVVSVSINTVLTTASYYCRYTGTGSNTITLPAANAYGAGKTPIMVIRHAGTGGLTVSRAGTDTIDGGTTITLAAGQGVMLLSDGTSSWDTN